MAKTRFLFEILVPCYRNNGKPVRTRHHQEWDKVVRRIAGGLTIYKPAIGQWVDVETDDLYKERVIPVRIACTDKQIEQIARFTMRHYDQLAVLAYVVSEKVLIFKSDNDQKRKDKGAGSVHKSSKPHRGRLQKEDCDSAADSERGESGDHKEGNSGPIPSSS